MIDQMFRQEIKNAEIIKHRGMFFKYFCYPKLKSYQKLEEHKNGLKGRMCKWLCCWCCNTEPLIDPERMNPFLDSLIDPFKNKEEKGYIDDKAFLETLWFQAGEQEWLSERENPRYYNRMINDMESGLASRRRDDGIWSNIGKLFSGLTSNRERATSPVNPQISVSEYNNDFSSRARKSSLYV